MKKVLVTGGLGFVGSHLVDTLLEENCEITIVDNMSSNTVEPEFYKKRCSVEICNIEDYEHGSNRFDEIYHLADIVGPAGILPYGGELGIRSMAGANKVFAIAEKKHTRVTIVSSSEVYGRPGKFSESDDLCVYEPYTVRLEYAVAKILTEVAAINATKTQGLIVNIVRPYNIAGPRQLSRRGFVIPRFFEAALKGKPIQVFGDGKQVRCFAHVRDTVASLLAVQRCGQTRQIFNSGNPRNRITIYDLAVKVRAICNSNSEIVHVDPKDVYGDLYAEVFDKIPDTGKIEGMLRWQAHRSIDNILIDVLKFYKSQRSNTEGPIRNMG